MIVILVLVALLVSCLKLVRHFITESRSSKSCHICCSVMIGELRCWRVLGVGWRRHKSWKDRVLCVWPYLYYELNCVLPKFLC